VSFVLPSRQKPRRPLQEECQEAGSIDAANAPGSTESRFLTCESIASVFLERPPTGARPRLYWCFHHLHCLSNRCRSDRPRSTHPCRLLQVLALSSLVSFSLKVFNILWVGSVLAQQSASMRAAQLVQQPCPFHCHASMSVACYWYSLSPGQRGMRAIESP
jgi:hypothetical protein